MDGLFRNEAVKAQQPQWLGSTRLALPVSHRVWGILAALTTVTMVGWLFLGHYTRREHVVGRLVPNAGLIHVTARIAGTVAELSAAEGSSVRAGQVLVTVTGDRSSKAMGRTGAVVAAKLRDQQAQLRAMLKDARTQSDVEAAGLRQHIASLIAQMDQLDRQVALQRKHVATASSLVQRIAHLRQRGFISSVEFARYQADALAQKEQLKALDRQYLHMKQQKNALQVQLAQLPLDTATKAYKLRNQLAQLDAAMAKNAVQQFSVLRAPVSGVVSTVVVKPGQSVQPGQALVTVMPIRCIARGAVAGTERGHRLRAQGYARRAALPGVPLPKVRRTARQGTASLAQRADDYCSIGASRSTCAPQAVVPGRGQVSAADHQGLRRAASPDAGHDRRRGPASGPASHDRVDIRAALWHSPQGREQGLRWAWNATNTRTAKPQWTVTTILLGAPVRLDRLACILAGANTCR